MKKVYFLSLVLFSFLPVYSLDTCWNLEPVVIKNGMNNNTVYHVCHGNNGFMWFSTDRGITRYDGFRFRDYPLVMSIDSVSTPMYHAVRYLQEASGGLFYALLYQGGIICFDKERERFLPFRVNGIFKQQEISDFCWNQGRLYLATSQGLFKSEVVRKQEGKNSFIDCTISPQPLAKGKITDLCSDGQGNIYFSVDKKKVMHYALTAKKASLLKEYSRVGSVFFRGGYLWISRLSDDIVCYDLKKHKERIIPIGGSGETGGTGSYITDVVFKDKKTVYLSTWDGLFGLKFEGEDLCESPFALTLLTRNENAFRLNIENKMTNLCWDDKQQILWVGTFGGGVVKFDVSDSMYSRVGQDFKAGVNGIIEDEKGYIWLAMSDGDIMKSTTTALSMDTRFKKWEKASGISGPFCMYKGKSGNIWLGNSRGEVVSIHPLSETMKSFSLQKQNGEKIVSAVRCFCFDSWKRLWVGTGEGLLQVDPETHEGKEVKLSGNAKVVFAVTEDKEGNIWVGTDKGLKRLEFIGNEIRVIGDYEKKNGLEEASVHAIYVNNYNQIYVGYLNTVVRIDGRDKDKIESVYTLQKGLTNGHVECMVDDHIGNTWAGNNVGIMTIRNGQEAFYSYLTVGSCSAVRRLNDGRLLWANSWGLIFFDPSLTKGESGKKSLLLTDVEVNKEKILAGEMRNGQTILSVSPENQEKLVFSPNNNNFHLYFSDLRYGMMQRKMAYRLLPVDKEWKMTPLEKGLWYNGLPAGKYTLEAKLVFSDGREGEALEIPVVVKYRWFNTFWAYLGYALILIVLFYVIYYYSQKREVRKQVQRDREMLVRENLNIEKIKREQQQEIETMRSRLLMLFVQELRTPLSLIIAPLKDLQKDKANASNPSFQMVYRNAFWMLNACDQLLSLHEQGNLVTRLEVAPYEVEKVVDSNLLAIRELLRVHSIDFRCERRVRKDLEFYVDKKKIEFIIQNMLTHAFTHTHYMGTVYFYIQETVEAGLHYVSLVVEDDRQMQVEKDLSTSQLGFTILRQMVEAHHGTISLENPEGGGTKVTVNLPVDKSVFENDPNIKFVIPEELSEVTLDPVEPLKPELAADSVAEEGISVPAEALPEEECVPVTRCNSKKTILIVEDHKDIRLYLKVLFGKEYNLLMAINGQEGIDMAAKELPDLILCDIMMPVKDGFQCCREVKEGVETCSIPFIMLTAKVEDEDIIRGLELGADDYVLKPFTPSILKAKVRNLINGRLSLKQMYTKLLKLPGAEADVAEETEQVEEAVKVEDPFISSVIKIVEENICEPDFSVKKLAAEMNMSQPTLYRKVKQSTDYTIIELILGVRMRRAGALLKTKQYAVQEVAEMVGYNDIPTFRKHFVDAFGTTPSTYE